MIIYEYLLDTIRVWNFRDPPPDDDYRKCHPHHAPTYLASYLHRVRSLEILPSMTRHPRDLYTENTRFHDVVGDHFFKYGLYQHYLILIYLVSKNQENSSGAIWLAV